MRPAVDGGSRFGIVLNGSPLFTGGAGSGRERNPPLRAGERSGRSHHRPAHRHVLQHRHLHLRLDSVATASPPHRKGKVQLIDASSFWQKMRKSLGSKRKELSDEHIDEITRLFGEFKEVDAGTACRSAASSRTRTSATARSRSSGRCAMSRARSCSAAKGKNKGKPQPDADLRDTENVPLNEDVEDYFKREVLPHVPDAWIDHEKTKVGYEIPFNRHFYVFKPPRSLEEIDAELKGVTAKIMTMLEGLAE